MENKMSQLEELAKTVNAKIITYGRDTAVNVVIPNVYDGKPLTIMTPSNYPLEVNAIKAREMLQDHIDKRDTTTEHYRPET